MMETDHEPRRERQVFDAGRLESTPGLPVEVVEAFLGLVLEKGGSETLKPSESAGPVRVTAVQQHAPDAGEERGPFGIRFVLDASLDPLCTSFRVSFHLCFPDPDIGDEGIFASTDGA